MIGSILLKLRFYSYVVFNLSRHHLFDRGFYELLKWVFIIRAVLPRHADPATVSMIAKLPFSALSIRELSMYRISDLANTCVLLFKRRQLVSALIVARGILETTAILYCLQEQLADANKSENIDSIIDFMNKALLGGTGIDDKNIYPFAIGKLIAKVDSRIDYFSDYYAKLSRFAHPSYDSLLDSYGRIDEQKILLKLGLFHSKKNDDLLVHAVVPTIQLFIKTYDALPAEITRFSKLCEKKIKKRNRKGTT